MIYAQLGDNEKALNDLDNGQPPAPGGWYKFEPLYEPLREEPRFKALLKRAGL